MTSLDRNPSADEQQGGWYQRFIKKHQKLARHVSTAMVLGGIAGMFAISIAAGGMPALTPLVCSGVGACVGSLMGGHAGEIYTQHILYRRTGRSPPRIRDAADRARLVRIGHR